MSITLLDGGMGQELLARQPEAMSSLWSVQFLLDYPELVRAVHDDYFTAGAEIATVNSYSIHHDRMESSGLSDRFDDLHRLACELAVASRDTYGSGRVAGSLGPLGWSYRPDLAPPAEQAAEAYAKIVKLQAPLVDLFICETMSSVDQARGALMGTAVADKPVWLAVSVQDDDGSKLRSGEDLRDILALVAEMKPEALLINCSSPEAVGQAITALGQIDIPLGGYANGFVEITAAFAQKDATVDALEARKDLGPEAYADFTDDWIAKGASIIGGCCEVGPAHIAEISRRFGRSA